MLCGITPDVTDIECLAFGQEAFIFSEFYKKFTKSAQSSGPENIGPEGPLSGHLAPLRVLSPSHINLENNGRIRPQADLENAFTGVRGGGDGPDIQPSPL